MSAKHPIVVAHREAMSAYEHAKHEVRCCAQDSTTTCSKPCPCEVYQQMLEKQADLQKKADALKKHNEAIVKANDKEMTAQLRQRKKERAAKARGRKPMKIDIPPVQKKPRIHKTAVTEPVGTKSNIKSQPQKASDTILESQSKTEQQVVAKETVTVVETETNTNETPKLTRKDLTKERYLHHRDVEEMTDKQIRKKYGDIPESSFNAWKKAEGLVKSKKLTNEATASATEHVASDTITLSEHKALQTQYLQLEQDYVELKNANGDLINERKSYIQKINELTQKLNIERDMNEARGYVIKQMEEQIAELKHQTLTSDVPDDEQSVAAPVAETDDVSPEVRANYYERLYNETALAHDRLQQEIISMAHAHDAEVNELLQRLEDIEKVFDRQMDKLDEYEDVLYQRIGGLKMQKRSLREYIATLENDGLNG